MNRTAASTAVVLALFACGACAPRADRPVDRAEPTVALSPAAVDLVTDSGDRPARHYQVEEAEEEMTRRCMGAAGRTYRPFVPPLPPGDDEHRLVDLPGRHRHGYGIAAPPSPPGISRGEKTAGYHRALFGSPTQDRSLTLPNDTVVSFPGAGCVAQSRVTVSGDISRWARVDSIPQILDNALRSQVRGDPRLTEATSRWATCMREAHFPYATPDDARAAVGDAYARRGGAVHTWESAVAVADGTCDLQVSLTATELALRRSAAATLPLAQQHELEELAAIDCRAGTTAARFLNRPATPCHHSAVRSGP